MHIEKQTKKEVFMRLFRSLVNLLTISLKADKQDIDLEEVLDQAKLSLEGKTSKSAIEKSKKSKFHPVGSFEHLEKSSKKRIPKEIQDKLRAIKLDWMKKYSVNLPINMSLGHFDKAPRLGLHPLGKGKSVVKFIKEKCHYHATGLSLIDDLYNEYLLWAREKNIDAKCMCSRRRFMSFFSPKKIHLIRMMIDKKAKRFFMGVELKDRHEVCTCSECFGREDVPTVAEAQAIPY